MFDRVDAGPRFDRTVEWAVGWMAPVLVVVFGIDRLSAWVIPKRATTPFQSVRTHTPYAHGLLLLGRSEVRGQTQPSSPLSRNRHRRRLGVRTERPLLQSAREGCEGCNAFRFAARASLAPAATFLRHLSMDRPTDGSIDRLTKYPHIRTHRTERPCQTTANRPQGIDRTPRRRNAPSRRLID